MPWKLQAPGWTKDPPPLATAWPLSVWLSDLLEGSPSRKNICRPRPRPKGDSCCRRPSVNSRIGGLVRKEDGGTGDGSARMRPKAMSPTVQARGQKRARLAKAAGFSCSRPMHGALNRVASQSARLNESVVVTTDLPRPCQRVYIHHIKPRIGPRLDKRAVRVSDRSSSPQTRCRPPTATGRRWLGRYSHGSTRSQRCHTTGARLEDGSERWQLRARDKQRLAGGRGILAGWWSRACVGTAAWEARVTDFCAKNGHELVFGILHGVFFRADCINSVQTGP